MDSIDKGLREFNGKPLVRHAVDRLAPQVQHLMISASRNLETYQSFGVPVWPDAMPDFAGPLAGLQTGLMHCRTPHMATAPCDSPFFPDDLVERLRDALEAAHADLAVAVTGEGDARQLHPVFCLLKTSLLPRLTLFLQNGERKMQAWFATLNMVEAYFQDESAFGNINTLEDLRKFSATSAP